MSHLPLAVLETLQRLLAPARAPVTLAQYRALRAVADGAERVFELQRALGVGVATASEVSRRLADLGLLEKHPDLRDKRCTRLRLTAKGSQVRRAYEEAIGKAWSKRLAGLSHPLRVMEALQSLAELLGEVRT